VKILIIGSEGFIGSHLIHYFSSIEWQVYGTDVRRPLQQTYPFLHSGELNWDEIFRVHQFDFCINAAGNGSVAVSFDNPALDYKLNTQDVFHILESIRNYNKTCRYLHISSAAVYGNPLSLPIREADVAAPLSPYGWHKLAAEQICREFSEVFGLNIIIVRPFSVYGPGLKKQLFWDAYQKYRSSSGQAIDFFGTGEESRDFLYIDDLVRMSHDLLLHAEAGSGVFNLASGIEIKIRDAIFWFFEAMGAAPQICFSGQKHMGNPDNWRADIQKIKTVYNSQPTDFREGVRKLAHWIKHQ
jgi:dTDP-glucose 4,6-dehydratase/UDP-glucose 4-epimerase